jgi:APA family basic amino acid/polyamine antiporter
MSNQLRLYEAVFVGIAAMLGAGVFVVFAPAASLAGFLLPIAVVLAGIVAFLNARSVSTLAAQVSRPGGAYSYAQVYLSQNWAFLAGSSFLIGKIASSAAIALAVSGYLFPEQRILVAVLSVVAMATINILGINRTALGSVVLGGITLVFLVFAIIVSLVSFPSERITQSAELQGFGVLTAAAIIFFAFAGYARVATLGDELRDSKRNTPRAVGISFAVVFSIYLAFSFVMPAVLGDRLIFSIAPMVDLLNVALPQFPSEVVVITAGIASLGSLLALLAGMSRTASVMGEDAELPKLFALRGGPGNAPWFAELTISLVVIVLILSGDLVWAIGLSSFAILTYYAVANLASFRQPASENRSRASSLAGLMLCLAIGLSVPIESLLVGVFLVAAVVGLRIALFRLRNIG